MCKIIMAEMHGRDLHIACEEMVVMQNGEKVIIPDVYGTDSEFTMDEAIKAFKSRHKAEEARKTPTVTVLDAVIGEEI